MENQVSVKQWVITILLLSIPIVNIVLLFMWAFGEKNLKTNYAKAMLIVMACYTGIVIILAILGGIIASFSMDEYSSSEWEEDGNVYVSDFIEEDIEVLEISLEDGGGEFGEYITGRIRNNSVENTHESVTISVNFYNEENMILGSETVTFDAKIPPGQVYEFREFISDVYVERITEAKSVEILDIY